MTGAVTCVIVDDHSVVREGLRLRLAHSNGIDVVGECSTGRDAVDLVRTSGADVALLDIDLPDTDGITLTRQIVELELSTRIVIFSATTDHTLIKRAFDAGALGFVGKEARVNVVEDAIQAVTDGTRYLDPAVAARMMTAEQTALSGRELDVLQLMADGLTNAQIAQQLSLSEDTVKTHISTILRKTETSGRAGAVAEAFRRRLVR
jgi:DNA-binding NarL/FixJ family response regulator